MMIQREVRIKSTYVFCFTPTSEGQVRFEILNYNDTSMLVTYLHADMAELIATELNDAVERAFELQQREESRSRAVSLTNLVEGNEDTSL